MSKNVNQNVNTIIFPEGMEIRKIRKKKKKKAPSKKKEAIEELKSVLQQFDIIVNEAKQKNITLPKELGVLPQNINEIDSLSEIVALTNTLRQRITAIRELINKGAQPSLFGDIQFPQRAGVFPVSEPIVRPEIIQPIQPQPIQPIQPQPQPQPQPDDDTAKTLEQLRNEILQKLTPEQRQEAEKKLEEERQKQAPEEPSIPQPTEPLPDVQAGDLETNLNIKFGTQTIPKLVSPVGFYSILTDYRRYIESVLSAPILIADGQYRLPTDKLNELESERNRILDKYDKWLNSLNKAQLAYIDSDAVLLSINNEMLKDLNEDSSVIVERLLRQRVGDKNVKQFEAGDKPVQVEEEIADKLSEKGKQYKTLLESVDSDLDDLKRVISLENVSQLTKEKFLTYRKRRDELNNMIVKIDEYEKLSGTDKAILEVQKNQVMAKYNKISDAVNITLSRVKTAGEMGQTKPSDIKRKVREKAKSQPEPQPEPPLQRVREKAENLKLKIDKLSSDVKKPKKEKPEPEPLTNEQEKALIVLLDYLKNGGKFNDPVKKSLAKLPEGQEIIDEAVLIGKTKTASQDKKKLVRDYLARLRDKEGGAIAKYLQDVNFGQF